MGEGGIEVVRASLDDDLDLPSAYAALDEAARRGQGVSAAAELLGLLV
jgi:L-cysteine:1D-myo-inositol 2-amino-2-deoxy-alpha-D-glucopyranoside ligase